MDTTTQDVKIKDIDIKMPDAFKDLQEVISKDGGLNASASTNFKNRIFGRDSLEAAEDLLPIYPKIVEEVIFSLASLQGVTENPLNEEEFGKIHHEFFKGDENRIGKLSYDTVDATPLYIRLINDYILLFGDEILSKTYIDKNKEKQTIKESLLRALTWLEKKVTTSSLKLIEFQKKIPVKNSEPWNDFMTAIIDENGNFANHIENQVWTDSFTALIHENGVLANHKAPIAAIEVQGIAYDAFMKSCHLFEEEMPEKAKAWEQYAKIIQKQTLTKFWMNDKKYFARAIERDKNNKPRQIKTISANPAELLNTTIFDSLAPATKRKYLGAIISMIFSNQLLTDYGIRSRALKYINLVKFADYHGSKTTWIKETYDIAKGLRKQGFSKLASQLETRILNAVNITKNHYEFFYVEADGTIHLYPQAEITDDVNPQKVIATNIPEDKQTWTITAIIAIQYADNIGIINPADFKQANKVSHLNVIKILQQSFILSALTITQEVQRYQKQSKWEYTFENHMLHHIPIIPLLKTKEDILQALIEKKYFTVDTAAGIAMEYEHYRQPLTEPMQVNTPYKRVTIRNVISKGVLRRKS